MPESQSRVDRKKDKKEGDRRRNGERKRKEGGKLFLKENEKGVIRSLTDKKEEWEDFVSGERR